jgi:hypothetical protein
MPKKRGTSVPRPDTCPRPDMAVWPFPGSSNRGPTPGWGCRVADADMRNNSARTPSSWNAVDSLAVVALQPALSNFPLPWTSALLSRPPIAVNARQTPQTRCGLAKSSPLLKVMQQRRLISHEPTVYQPFARSESCFEFRKLAVNTNSLETRHPSLSGHLVVMAHFRRPVLPQQVLVRVILLSPTEKSSLPMHVARFFSDSRSEQLDTIRFSRLSYYRNRLFAERTSMHFGVAALRSNRMRQVWCSRRERGCECRRARPMRR